MNNMFVISTDAATGQGLTTRWTPYTSAIAPEHVRVRRGYPVAGEPFCGGLDTSAVANLACLQPPSWPGATPSASPAVSCA